MTLTLNSLEIALDSIRLEDDGMTPTLSLFETLKPRRSLRRGIHHPQEKLALERRI